MIERRERGSVTRRGQGTWQSRDRHRVERPADAVERTMGGEVVGLPAWVIGRARASAAAARGDKDEEMLQHLRAQAGSLRCGVDSAAIDRALADDLCAPRQR